MPRSAPVLIVSALGQVDDQQSPLLLGSQLPCLRRKRDGLAADAQVLIAGSFTGRITLDGLSRTLGVSPFALCRAFRQATGGTLHQHLTRLRLAAALEQLPHYRERLTDLALDLGFSSHSHFTCAFRGYFGRAPSALLHSACVG